MLARNLTKWFKEGLEKKPKEKTNLLKKKLGGDIKENLKALCLTIYNFVRNITGMSWT